VASGVPDIVCNVGDGAKLSEEILRVKYRAKQEGMS
jgi:hypothetical protein